MPAPFHAVPGSCHCHMSCLMGIYPSLLLSFSPSLLLLFFSLILFLSLLRFLSLFPLSCPARKAASSILHPRSASLPRSAFMPRQRSFQGNTIARSFLPFYSAILLWDSLIQFPLSVVYLFFSKPQRGISAANGAICCISLLFFSKPQPKFCSATTGACCISLLFFSKPQLHQGGIVQRLGCISLLFFSKPQRFSRSFSKSVVVYLFSSSASHNNFYNCCTVNWLYISSLLQQATTFSTALEVFSSLYISSLLQQATTLEVPHSLSNVLYISSLLQQATT